MNWHWWFVTFLGLLVLEVAMPGLFAFACLAGGALVACLAGMLGAGAGLGWLLFGGGALLLLATAAPAARRWGRASKHTAGCLRGQRALVIAALDPPRGRGVVQVAGGARWRAAAQAPIAAGTWVEGLAVRGGRLQVRRAFPGPPGPGIRIPFAKVPAAPADRARPGRS